MSEPAAEYVAGDTYSYRSVTQLHIVTWTRDEQGLWHADDDRGVTATDDDIRLACLVPEPDTNWYDDGELR